jgi:hypothetical protein
MLDTTEATFINHLRRTLSNDSMATLATNTTAKSGDPPRVPYNTPATQSLASDDTRTQAADVAEELKNMVITKITPLESVNGDQQGII